MRKEETFKKNIGSLFSEAYDVESTPLLDSLKAQQEHFADIAKYSEGGLKTIHLCRDCRTNRRVAMATLKDDSDPQKVEAFIREAKLNAALQHPNIVPVYEVGIDGESPWFTMKFIAGRSLEELLDELTGNQENELSDLNSRLDVFIKICDAISYAHSLGVLHLDIKPANIRISNYGDVVVCDWGLADVISSECDESLLEYCSLVEYDLTTLTVDGTVKGTLGYMSPEQTSKTKIRKGTHTDVFSLGAVLYSLLTFHKAFTGESFTEVIDKTATCDFPPPSFHSPEVPQSLEAVCLKAMSLKVEDRYASVADLKKEIVDFRNGFATDAENASLLKSLKLFYLRHKTVSLISSFTFILIVVLGVLALNHMSLTRENAVQLAEKLSIEAEYHRKINKDAAPLFLERAYISFKAQSLEDCLNFCNSVIELDETILEAWELKAKVYFVYADLEKSVEAFRKAKVSSELSKLAEEYLTKVPKVADIEMTHYLSLMEAVFALRNYGIFGKMTNLQCYSKDLSIEDRIAFVKGEIRIRHAKKMKEERFMFKFDRESGHLDLSDNKWLNTVLCLQNFPAKSVDLSNTSVSNGIGLRAQTLESLNISRTNMIELQTLECDGLKELIVAHTGVSNLKPVAHFPIERLDIQHTGVRSLRGLAAFRKLKEVIVSKDQFSDDELKKLPAHIKVTIAIK
ncbi:MAG: protein kinase [Lentisphaeraceae bacterium]|nr:protein kinase [Lentisphaeraceae bacterium]